MENLIVRPLCMSSGKKTLSSCSSRTGKAPRVCNGVGCGEDNSTSGVAGSTSAGKHMGSSSGPRNQSA